MTPARNASLEAVGSVTGRSLDVCVICATHDPEVIAVADQELRLIR